MTDTERTYTPEEIRAMLSENDTQAEQIKRLKERIAANEQNHRLAEVSGINKAIRMLNREYHVAATLSEMVTLNRIIKELTEEGKVLLEEAETLTIKN